MRIVLTSLLLGLCFLPTAQGGEEGMAGNWRVTLLEKADHMETQQLTLWLLRLENKGGKMEGTVDPANGVAVTTVEKFEVSGDLLNFTLKIKGGPTLQFEVKLPRAGAKKIFGTFAQGNQIVPVMFEATTAKTFYDAGRDLVARSPNDPRVFGTVLDLILQSKDKKLAAKEVQEWSDIVLRAAENYGPRWQLDYSLRLIDVLQTQPEFAPVAVETARKVEAGLDAKAPAATRLRVLSAQLAALKASTPKGEKLPEKAKEIEARIDTLETQAFTEYESKAFDFKIEKFKGRKGKSKRAVLVELFTGAQCPPCVAADIGFDALEKAYMPADVVLLQYHLHIPGPDPLSNEDTEARKDYYGKAVRGTPTIFFNGVPDAQGGGGRKDAAEKFNEYQDVIAPLLEKEAAVGIKLSAVRKGDTVEIKANVSDLEKPGEKVRLRFALAEDWIRYKAPNGLSYHHRVVRALPGGAKGFALTKKDSEQSATVDLNELRGKLAKYLDDFAKSEEAFPDAQRPMRLRNLSVVAIVQNDETREVLQAVTVEVKGE